MERPIRRVVGLALSTLGVLSLASPVTATGGTTGYHVALGDSVAAGYQPDGSPPGDGYVARVHRALDTHNGLLLRNLACNGATTTSLIDGPGCTQPESQLVAAERLLRLHGSRVRLVTIDIGANNVNRCVAGTTVDDACVQDAVGVVAAELGVIVGRLRAAAPGVTIVGMTYYNPHVAAWLRGPQGQVLVRRSAPWAVLFNQVLTGVYTAGGARVADVAGAFASTDLDTPAPLPGGATAPLAVARICAWTWMCPTGGGAPDIHPNDAGHQVIAEAFLTALR
jgi:lysophospholipase L1-like esterase